MKSSWPKGVRVFRGRGDRRREELTTILCRKYGSGKSSIGLNFSVAGQRHRHGPSKLSELQILVSGAKFPQATWLASIFPASEIADGDQARSIQNVNVPAEYLSGGVRESNRRRRKESSYPQINSASQACINNSKVACVPYFRRDLISAGEIYNVSEQACSSPWQVPARI